ncbi:hypothetical protein DFJ73DRAFT_770529 [Zopfochytrium polystomum]|nr:hypothetical protein DFJ73DRAFT_770529 [Zopfochytrium polystomum]
MAWVWGIAGMDLFLQEVVPILTAGTGDSLEVLMFAPLARVTSRRTSVSSKVAELSTHTPHLSQPTVESAADQRNSSNLMTRQSESESCNRSRRVGSRQKQPAAAFFKATAKTGILLAGGGSGAWKENMSMLGITVASYRTCWIGGNEWGMVQEWIKPRGRRSPQCTLFHSIDATAVADLTFFGSGRRRQEPVSDKSRTSHVLTDRS